MGSPNQAAATYQSLQPTQSLVLKYFQHLFPGQLTEIAVPTRRMWKSFAAAENSIQTVFSALHGQRNNDEAIQNVKLPKLFAGTTAMAAYKGTSSQVFTPMLQLTDGKLTPGMCPGPFPSEIQEVNLNMKMVTTKSWQTKKFIKCYNCFTVVVMLF